MSTTELPYAAVSVNGRAMEWKGPLWDAIHAYQNATNEPAREQAVIAVEAAVEGAMRLALESVARPTSLECPRCSRPRDVHPDEWRWSVDRCLCGDRTPLATLAVR